MSLTSYRAAPPRGEVVSGLPCWHIRPVRPLAGGVRRENGLRVFALCCECAVAFDACALGIALAFQAHKYWPGGDLLSHVLRRSTIGATGLNGRVRDGTGCFPRAMTTRPVKRPCGALNRSGVESLGVLAGARTFRRVRGAGRSPGWVLRSRFGSHVLRSKIEAASRGAERMDSTPVGFRDCLSKGILECPTALRAT